MSEDMRRDFESREDLIAYLREEFPDATAVDETIPDTRGGRKAAEDRLQSINPRTYAKTRNYLDGDVTYLSPYIRHGVLNLAEVRDVALEKVDHTKDAEKFINELGWRDYWQRKYIELGDNIWVDQEAYKTGFPTAHYADDLPEDIPAGETGLDCIDAFSRTLRETGYLHNHVRMYLAAYVVHWRGVKWQAGARWFLTHLLDGDPASNNLSWQWVASTFSHKPYMFNRANLEKFTGGVYCKDCPLYGDCDFEGSYEEIAADLFPNTDEKELSVIKTVVWVHGDCLIPYNPALQAVPDASALFVWDDRLLAEWKISLKRIVFMYECLLELPVTIRRGEMAAELSRFVTERGAERILTTESPSPHFIATCNQLQTQNIQLEILPVEPLINYEGEFDLKRFSRFWRKAQKYAYPHDKTP